MLFGPSCVDEFRLSEINSIDSKIVLDSARSNRYVSAYSTIGSKFQFHYQQVLQAHEDNVGERVELVENVERDLCYRGNTMRLHGSPAEVVEEIPVGN